jgi:hypothetical protein
VITTERDPRVDPKPGDKLSQRMPYLDRPTSTVLVHHVEETRFGPAVHGLRDGEPRSWMLPSWQRIMSEADVLERAP